MKVVYTYIYKLSKRRYHWRNSHCPNAPKTNSSGMSERKQGTAQPHRDSAVLGFRANLRNGWSHGTLCLEFQKMYSLSSPILFVSFLKSQGPTTYWHIGIELSRWLWTSYSFNNSFCSRRIFKMLSCITAVIMNISIYPHTQGSAQQTTQHTKCPGQNGGSGKATVSPNDRAQMNKMSQWGIQEHSGAFLEESPGHSGDGRKTRLYEQQTGIWVDHNKASTVWFKSPNRTPGNLKNKI